MSLELKILELIPLPGPLNLENIENDDKFLNDLKNKVPLGRIGNSNEINGPNILASNASSCTTLILLMVDGLLGNEL